VNDIATHKRPVTEEDCEQELQHLNDKEGQRSDEANESGVGPSWRLGFIREIEHHLGGHA
jgi:hypothetical protein